MNEAKELVEEWFKKEKIDYKVDSDAIFTDCAKKHIDMPHLAGCIVDNKHYLEETHSIHDIANEYDLMGNKEKTVLCDSVYEIVMMMYRNFHNK